MPDTYFDLLPIQQREIETGKGKWIAQVTHEPKQGASDRVLFPIYFEPRGQTPGWRGPSVRNLNLWISDHQLRIHRERYTAEVLEFIRRWLEGDGIQEEREYLGSGEFPDGQNRI